MAHKRRREQRCADPFFAEVIANEYGQLSEGLRLDSQPPQEDTRCDRLEALQRCEEELSCLGAALTRLSET